MGSDSGAELTVFTYRYSFFAQRVSLALAEKGIPHKAIVVDLSKKPKELLETNPIWGKVPAISHNGNSVVESLVILEYLEDSFPEKNPLMPKGAFEKSKVRFWSDYIYKGFASSMEGFKLKPRTPEREANKEATVKFIKTLDQAITDYSTNGPFFTGEKFGFLDVVLAPLTCLLPLLEKQGGVSIPGPDKIPRLHKWLEATKAHPCVTSTFPGEEESLGYFRGVFWHRRAVAAAATAAAPQ